MRLLACLLAALLLLAACTTQAPEEKPLEKGTALPPPNPTQPSPESDRVQPPEASNVSGLANPASVNCAKLGGASEILTDAYGGAYGLCRFPDGRECEEWALLRDGRCVPH